MREEPSRRQPGVAEYGSSNALHDWHLATSTPHAQTTENLGFKGSVLANPHVHNTLPQLARLKCSTCWGAGGIRMNSRNAPYNRYRNLAPAPYTVSLYRTLYHYPLPSLHTVTFCISFGVA